MSTHTAWIRQQKNPADPWCSPILASEEADMLVLYCAPSYAVISCIMLLCIMLTGTAS